MSKAYFRRKFLHPFLKEATCSYKAEEPDLNLKAPCRGQHIGGWAARHSHELGAHPLCRKDALLRRWHGTNGATGTPALQLLHHPCPGNEGRCSRKISWLLRSRNQALTWEDGRRRCNSYLDQSHVQEISSQSCNIQLQATLQIWFTSFLHSNYLSTQEQSKRVIFGES